MYSGYGFRKSEIGDVEVIKHNGTYHLFHLTLPNHGYIAHATSEDGLHWQRVQNALFISDPGNWDDDMLWTMDVSPDPYREHSWRMFYTGLCMREDGRIQRVGLAHSDDLYNWVKDDSGHYPLEIPGDHYEHSLDEGRQWVSFRDPFYFHDDDVYMLAAARVNHGPIIRRGCVALTRETAENHFEFLPPLFHPMRYDDIEVPNLVKLNDRYYLIGSIREDIKVHYWWADSLRDPYQNYADNVLMPQGNYAARICWDEDHYLVWNFFFKGLTPDGPHLMAPPKALTVNGEGQLRLETFAGFEKLVSQTLFTSDLVPLQLLFNNPTAGGSYEDVSCWFGCESGMELFLVQGTYRNFLLSGTLTLEGYGKCGLVFHLNEQGDGYYLSLELFKGIAQIRAWCHQPDGGIEAAFHYDQLQAAHFVPTGASHHFALIAYEQYIEFSIDGYILLTLADDQFREGRAGFYVESANIRIDDLTLKACEKPSEQGYSDNIASQPHHAQPTADDAANFTAG